MRRLLLVRHAATSATRRFAFPTDEPLDDRGRADAVPLADLVAAPIEVLASPAVCCLQTAEAAGLSVNAVDAAIAECDFGRWRGRTVKEVVAEGPEGAEAVGAWMTDPAACPHGGETLIAFAARVGRWLDSQAQLDGRAIAITHGGVVKAAVVHALRAPIESFWRVDIAPLSITELHAHDGRWTLTKANVQLAENVPRGGMA